MATPRKSAKSKAASSRHDAAAAEPASPQKPSDLRTVLLAALTAVFISCIMAGLPKMLVKKADLRGWLGRPALELSDARALLIVGTMASGTVQKTRELQALGLEVEHEVSDSGSIRCRDGTVSWAHAMRFFSPPSRARVIDSLCQGPRFNTWSSAMFDGSPQCVRAKDHYWDDCWQAECKRVASSELGCALEDAESGRSCVTPFAATLLQVRHPLRTVATLVRVFCGGEDTAAAAANSTQLDTFELFLPTPAASPPGTAAGGAAPTDGERRGECTRRFGWMWVSYIRAVRPHATAWFRVEDTNACDVLTAAGVLDANGAAAASPVPPKVAQQAARGCAELRRSQAARSPDAHHGRINSRNVGAQKVVVTVADVQAIDPQLAEEMRTLARELGYGEL